MSEATKNQKTFIRSLIEERAGQEEAEEIRIRLNAIQDAGQTLSFEGAGAAIEALKSLPKTEQATAGDPTPGYYAVVPEHDLDGPLRFYRVSEGKGRWEGKVFLSVRAGDEWHPVSGHRKEIMAQVKNDPEASSRYGTELGRCSKCNRTLTDETSRALGIGPECRSRA